MTTFFDLMRNIVNALNAVVRIDSQDLSEIEKAMARTNIDAAGQVELVEVKAQVNNATVDVKNTKEQLKTIKEEILNEIKELPVKTTNQIIEDDPRPVTSGAVYQEFSKAVALLKTI